MSGGFEKKVSSLSSKNHVRHLGLSSLLSLSFPFFFELFPLRSILSDAVIGSLPLLSFFVHRELAEVSYCTFLVPP